MAEGRKFTEKPPSRALNDAIHNSKVGVSAAGSKIKEKAFSLGKKLGDGGAKIGGFFKSKKKEEE